jgi:predicted secreted Zn-dependent protease
MLGAIGDRWEEFASSDDAEVGEDEDDEENQQGKLSEDNKPGRVMGTTTKMVQQHMERFRQKQMKFDELTNQG